MKYILLMQFPLSGWKTETFDNWPRADADRHMAFLRQLNEDLIASGEFVETKGLAGWEAARIVRAKGDGSPAVMDGPFAETKEFLAGWWIIDVASAERAYEIAAKASAGPGRGGEPLNMPIEVRPVMFEKTL
ncbi:YciI family protein [soil metagenome]